MAGIINDAKKQPGAEPPKDDAAPAAAGGDDITPASVRGQMNVPPDMRQAYERIVMAGRKILYSEQMAPQIAELMQGEGEVSQKLGMGAAALISLLVDKARGAIPPQLILPAATELVAEAAAFLRDAGVKVTKEDIAEGMAVMIETILKAAGVQLDQLPQLLQQQAGGQPAQPQAPAPQGA